MWSRVKAAWHLLVDARPAGAEIVLRRSVVRVEIKLSGSTVQTDMEVTMPLLESIANGIGLTLIPMPSKERH
jgi:hypothetical protein